VNISRRAIFWLLLPAFLIITMGLVGPLLWLFYFSLLASDAGIPTSEMLTSANYARLFSDFHALAVYGNTFKVSIYVTFFAIAFGYPLATWIAKLKGRKSAILTLVVISPLLVSIVITSYGWLVVLGTNGILNKSLMTLGLINQPIKWLYSTLAIVIGLTHIVLPFMVLSLLSALEKIDRNVIEAAAVLGAKPLKQFYHVTLPLSLPGLISGIALSFTICMSAYVTPAVLGPSGPQFITTLIFNQFVTFFDWGMGSSMAIALFLLGMGLVFLFLKAAYRYGGIAAGGQV